LLFPELRFGLNESSVELFNLKTGNFNTSLTRQTCLFVVLAVQLILLFNYLSQKFKKPIDSPKPASSIMNTRNKTKKSNAASSPEVSDSQADSQAEETPSASPRAANNHLKAN
jgi:hypothetical protein